MVQAARPVAGASPKSPAVPSAPQLAQSVQPAAVAQPPVAPIPREKTSRLVARALGLSPQALEEAFRPATPADLPGVLALRHRVLGEALSWDDARYVRWRYLPEAGGRGLATCWVCVRGEEVLGMIGTEALQVSAGEARREVHAAMDLMVQPDLADSGLGVWINQTVCARLGCVLAIGSNPNSRSVLARTFETLPDRRSYTHPLHFAHFMAKRLSPRPLAWLASRAADLLMVGLRGWRLWTPGAGLSMAQLTHMDDAVAADIEALLRSAQRPDRVEVARDVATLAHRLLANPRTRCEVWLVRHGARPVGMVATRRVPIEEGRHAVQVLDAVLDATRGPAAQRAVLRTLLAGVCARAYRGGADYLSWTLYDPALEAELQPLMFRLQPHPFETLSWVCPDADFRAAVLSRPGWSLSEIHTDRDSA